MKKTASHANPGPSRRYGVSQRWRWRKSMRLCADYRLELLLVIGVVGGFGIEDERLRQRLLGREDERALGRLRIELDNLLLRPLDRADVVHPRLDLRRDRRVVDEVHEGRGSEDVAADRDQHVVRPDVAA